MPRAPLVRYRSIADDSARWDGFAFREGDIIISTPPKCGTTWTQMICALLVFQTTEFDRPLALISPWLDMLTRERSSVLADLEAQEHRRFIKSHTPLDGLPFDERVTYICVGRDPRDVALSWDNHAANMNVISFINARQEAVGLEDMAEVMARGIPEIPESPLERFWLWVDDPNGRSESPANLAATLQHLTTFWDARHEPNVVLMHYDEMQRDLAGQMRALAARLAIEVPEDRWPELVRAATFDEMRGRAAELVPNSTNDLWHSNERFFNRGTSGQWRELLDDDCLRRYAARVHELVAADLSDWVHRGPIA